MENTNQMTSKEATENVGVTETRTKFENFNQMELCVLRQALKSFKPVYLGDQRVKSDLIGMMEEDN